MLRTVKIKGRNQPISFGMWAISNWCDAHNLTIGGLFNLLQGTENIASVDLTLKQVIDLAYYALVQGAAEKGKDFELSEAEVAKVFDQTPGLFHEIVAAFSASLASVFSAPPEKKAKATAKR